MSVARSELTTAVTLMRMALGLLDRGDESHAAVYLQRAIDVATRASVPAPLMRWRRGGRRMRLAAPRFWMAGGSMSRATFNRPRYVTDWTPSAHRGSGA